LPAFLRGGPAASVSREDILAGLALTGFFLEARALAPHGLGLPEARSRLASYLRQESS
jgi:DNA repair protein RecO (recombination protein O)